MRRLLVAALVLAGLVASASATAASQPTWTAKGDVTALHKQSIVVNGDTCRMTGSLARSVFSTYSVGDGAKIACANGLLQKIAVMPLPPIIIKTPPHQTGSGNFGSVSVGLSSSGIVSSSSGAFTFGGIPLSAIGDGSITVGTGTITLTCSIGDGSPDVSGFQVGDRITAMQCRNGALVSIARAT